MPLCACYLVPLLYIEVLGETALSDTRKLRPERIPNSYLKKHDIVGTALTKITIFTIFLS